MVLTKSTHILYNRAQSKWKSVALRLGLDFDAIEHDHKNDHSRVLHVFRDDGQTMQVACATKQCIHSSGVIYSVC